MRQLGEHNRDFHRQARHIALGGPGAELHRAVVTRLRVWMIVLGAFQCRGLGLDARGGHDVAVLQGHERLGAPPSRATRGCWSAPSAAASIWWPWGACSPPALASMPSIAVADA